MFTYNDYDLLKKAQLQRGKVYMTKDTRLMMYLGQSPDGKFLFYPLCSVLVEQTGFREYKMAHEEIQIKYLSGMIQEILGQVVTGKILEYISLPKIVAEFPCKNLQGAIDNWISKQMLLSGGQSKLPQIAKDSKVNCGFVGARDLEVGRVYYTGSSEWRSQFMFLGRTKGKRYMWLFISTVGDESLETLFNWAGPDIEVTQSNKRVRPSKQYTRVYAIPKHLSDAVRHCANNY